MKIYDKCEVGGYIFAILIDDKTKEAYEAVWYNDDWETDFSYPSLGIESLDVAGALDFEGAKKLGYKFKEW